MTSSSVLTVIPRKPAASQSGTPLCTVHVARVCRNVWRVTPSRPAALTTFFQAPCGSSTSRAPGCHGEVKWQTSC